MTGKSVIVYFVNLLPDQNLTFMTLNINGVKQEVSAEPGTDLLSVLRNELDLTGSKYGCGEGACGACMVLINGKPAPSCITPATDAVGKEIITIEGLEKNGNLHPVQEAFLKADPFQCSYCASGIIMSSVALLRNNSTPSENEIITAMNRNICRCGTYLNIVKAIRLAAK
ncbi:MAG: (2Fe-2S)-binding protein [Chitinophagaceae bacterium]